ncbi:hypothetical protein KIW84_073223 [Lathyrus oleraceus]|uniref:DUF4283 domain-containing protein n=1 Tax=Pisum sativum TaxID=3888 RepID=A0A9D4ZVA2_PEA|nr:hypothetical protein KIW84_073223 [Pisum sativum]
MDVDNGFFMVKCELLADREKIVPEGSWMLLDHYLALARWALYFASPLSKVKKTLVWIRFIGLNLLYYDKSVLGLASIVSTYVKKTSDDLALFVVPTMAQQRGPPENDDVHEQRLTKLHQEIGDKSVEIIAKESGEINVVHGDWLVVERKKRNKRVSYGQGKYLSNNEPRDSRSSKIKGIDVSLKGISVDSKTVRLKELDTVSKKQ